MNPPGFFTGGDNSSGGGNRPSPRKELQGPRPTALRVNKNSHKIRKPPVAPQSHHNQQQLAPPPLPADDREPVIIYAVSPKVIHSTVTDFPSLVQRLTGNTTEYSGGSTSAGDISPAARLASIEKTCPRLGTETSSNSNNDFMGDFSEDVEVLGGRFAGVLSPAPASLPSISPGFFSPAAADPFMMDYNMFLPSPSTLFSAPLVSPSPSASYDIFNSSFFDF